jgi:3-oxoacyl-[acyl-carrier-protein] synthase-3
MRFENVALHGLSYVEAPHRITSAAISDQLAPALARLNIRNDLLESITGIVARRFWDEGVQPSQVAAQAGAKAIEASGIDKKELGLLINTSVCKDFIEPSVASLVHNTLQLPSSCLNFDIGNACLAFLNGMTIAGNMIERGQIKHALLVDGEGSRFITQKTVERLLRSESTNRVFRDNFASLTLGSGAVALVLSRADLAPGGHRFLGGVSVAATEYATLCHGQPDEMITDASKLLIAGLGLAQKTWVEAQERMGWREAEINEFVLHQVSRTHTDQLADTLGINTEKVFRTYPEYGNIGPAAVPITLAKSVEAGRIKSGDRIGLMGIGSGLNCAMMEVVW